jgi:hypothetical protein
MKTIICSETLQPPTGPQLRAFSQTECQDWTGEVLWEVLKAWCEVRMEGLRVLQM